MAGSSNVPHPKEDNFLNLSLRCIYTNCDSIVNKVSEFELLLSSSNPHVIILTETKLHREILSQEVFPLSNYTVFRRDRDSANNVGDGVCILVRNDISSVSVNSDVILDDCECISCEIRVGSSKTLVG